MVDMFGVLLFEKRGNLLSKIGPMGLKQSTNLSVRISDDIGGPRFVALSNASRLLDTFESVAERPMPQIVQKGGDERNLSHRFIESLSISLHLTVENFNERSGRMENTD